MNEVFDFCLDQKIKNAEDKPNLKDVDHTNYSSRLPLLFFSRVLCQRKQE